MPLAHYIENIGKDFYKIGPAYWHQSFELLAVSRRLISHSLLIQNIGQVQSNDLDNVISLTQRALNLTKDTKEKDLTKTGIDAAVNAAIKAIEKYMTDYQVQNAKEWTEKIKGCSLRDLSNLENYRTTVKEVEKKITVLKQTEKVKFDLYVRPRNKNPATYLDLKIETYVSLDYVVAQLTLRPGSDFKLTDNPHFYTSVGPGICALSPTLLLRNLKLGRDKILYAVLDREFRLIIDKSLLKSHDSRFQDTSGIFRYVWSESGTGQVIKDVSGLILSADGIGKCIRNAGIWSEHGSRVENWEEILKEVEPEKKDCRKTFLVSTGVEAISYRPPINWVCLKEPVRGPTTVADRQLSMDQLGVGPPPAQGVSVPLSPPTPQLSGATAPDDRSTVHATSPPSTSEAKSVRPGPPSINRLNSEPPLADGRLVTKQPSVGSPSTQGAPVLLSPRPSVTTAPDNRVAALQPSVSGANSPKPGKSWFRKVVEYIF